MQNKGETERCESGKKADAVQGRLSVGGQITSGLLPNCFISTLLFGDLLLY